MSKLLYAYLEKISSTQDKVEKEKVHRSKQVCMTGRSVGKQVIKA